MVLQRIRRQLVSNGYAAEAVRREFREPFDAFDGNRPYYYSSLLLEKKYERLAENYVEDH